MLLRWSVPRVILTDFDQRLNNRFTSFLSNLTLREEKWVTVDLGGEKRGKERCLGHFEGSFLLYSTCWGKIRGSAQPSFETVGWENVRSSSPHFFPQKLKKFIQFYIHTCIMFITTTSFSFAMKCRKSRQRPWEFIKKKCVAVHNWKVMISLVKSSVHMYSCNSAFLGLFSRYV